MERLSKAIAFVHRTAQSAQELLRDKELRNKGLQTVTLGVQNRLQSIQNGIVQRAGQVAERIQDKQRQLQALLANLEERLNSAQHAWQLQNSRKAKVDVQFGRQLIADAPQEVRARLWYVLLENPHLAAPIRCEQPGAVPNELSDDEGDSGGDRGAAATTSGAADAAGAGLGGGDSGSRSASRLASSVAAALGLGRSGDRSNSGAAGGGGGSGSVSPLPLPGHRDRSGGTASPPPGPAPQPAAGAPGAEMGAAPASAQSPAPSLATPLLGRVSRAEAASSADPFSGSEMDGWEMIGGMVGPLAADGGVALGGSAAAALAAAHPEAVRVIMERLEALGPVPLDESGSDPVLVAQQAVLEAMLQVPWEPGVGLPAQTAPDSRFVMLNEMTAGQEEVDDSILRDIHRTFPEHPYFGMEAGQRALFRVLKAYSLHDLEVAYCQGMAFMAGVLLMYVPEEMAFRLFCRLMDPEGPNLRRLYLPGLEPLKAELATFELLLSWRLPDLAAHLDAFGLPPVLYVSQWLMTLFATPFPPPFCARVIDVLLQDGHDRLLLRCSFAVMEALEEELLVRHDFEALITYLKIEPVQWGLSRQRGIIERALTSPITDAEIDVARDMVASRQYLGSALGGSGGGGAEAAAEAGSSPTAKAASTAVEGVLGAKAAAGAGGRGGAVALLMPTQISFEHEVEAALAVAAATLTAGSAEAEGGGQVPARRQAGGCPCGPDMISFDDEGGGSRDRAVGAAAAAAGGGRGQSAGTAASGQASTHGHSGSTDHIVSAADFASGGNAASAGNGGGLPPSLMDDLDFVAAAWAPTRGSKPDPELEYGEYGELLVDAGLLLPELGAAGQAPAPSAAAGSGSAVGCGLQGPGNGGIPAASGGSQGRPSGSGPVATRPAAEQRVDHAAKGDLLLD